MKRSCRFFSKALLVLSLFAAASAYSATTEFRVLLDTDNNAATGCTVTTPAGTFAGAEQVLITTVVTTADRTGNVTGTALQTCSGGTLGTPVTLSSATWPVGFHDDIGIVETVFPLSLFGSSVPPSIRLGFVAASGNAVDSILTAPSGHFMMWPPEDYGRRRASGPQVEPQTIVLDGNGTDWGMITPFVAGGSGGPSLPHFINVYAFGDKDNLWFRFDAKIGGSAPSAADDTYSVRQGKTLNVAAPGVLANDSDPNNLPLTASATSSPQHGTLALDPSGSFIYVNNGSSSPVDSFTYKASNGTATSNDANVTINVIPDHRPVGVADTYNVPHGGTLTVPVPGVLNNDSDADGDHISAILQSGPQHGTLSLNPNGSFTYTHDGSNTTQDTFTYRVDDGVLTSNNVLVTITIGPDAAPVAVNDSYPVAEGGTLSVPAPGLFANDSDADTPQIQWTAQVVTGPAHGTLTLGTHGAFTYVHDGSETTSDSFTYTINDGIQTGNTATVNITVTPVNDAPVAVADSYTTLLEDTPFSVNAASGVLANDTDVDTAHSSLTAVLVTGPAHAASFALNADGSFNYTPAANYNGGDSFVYHAFDGALPSGDVTVTLSITAVNDVPSYTAGANVSVNEDSGAYSAPWATAISAGPADESGQALNFLVSNNNNGLFAVQPSLSPSGVLTFTPAANANGSATVSVQLHDNGGTANGGVDTSALQTFTINVIAVDDAPTVTVPGAQSMNEDATLTLTGATAISVGDIDAGGGNLTVTLAASNGTLTLGSTAGLTVSGNGTGSVQATGTIAALNTGLSGTVYAPNANYNGSDSIAVDVNDNGNTGIGGPLSANAAIAVTINGVNDAPTVTAPASASVNEDTTLNFTGPNAVSVADVDANGGNEQVTINATNGNVTLGTTTGLTVSGNGTASITATGTIANLNAALATLSFLGTLDYNGPASVQVTINDQGNSGSGGALSGNATVSITVNAVNDAPVATADNYSTNEDTPLTVNAASGVLANDTDVDTAHSSLTAVLVSGPSNASSFTLNADGSFNYTPNADFNGTDSFTYKANDGSLDSNTVTVTITVSAVNDAPVITRPASVSVNEDTALAFTGGNAVSIADVDAASGTMGLTLGVSNGTLTLGTTTGLTVSGNGTNAITASGTLANLNNALATLSYTASLNYSGSDTLTIGVNDNGNSGSGGPLSDAKSTAITVVAVNDAPAVSVPGAQSINEDSTLTFSSGSSTAITVADVDAGAGIVSVTLTSANGTITVGSTAGLNSNSGNGTGNVTITGTISALNTALEGTVFTPAADFNGTTSVDVTVDDNGNTGAGGALQANASVSITVNAVNDAPVITRPATATTNEDTPFTFSAGNVISIADVDAGTGNETVTLSVSNGTLTLAGTTNLTVSGDGTNSITAAGTLADLNNALNGLVYAPSANYNGPDTLSIGVNDQGNSGSGGPLTDAKSVAITVNPVNDAPVAVADNYSTNEDTPLTVNAASGVLANDTDIDTAHSSLTAVQVSGPSHASSFTLNNDGSFSYTPSADFNGSDSFTYKANDGSLDSNTVTVTITVNAVNDAPVITRPAAIITTEDTQVILNGPNTISIADVDAGSGSLSLTLGVLNGTLSLSGTTGLTVSGNGTNAITASGTLTDLNNALNAMTYVPNLNYNGPDTISISVDDNGNSGSGGALSDSKTTSIAITAVNDPPVNSVPGTQTIDEDTTLTFTGATAITVSDVDAGGADVTVTLSSPNGTITLGSTAGLTTVTGNGTGNVIATGPIATLNTDLNNTVFTPTADFNGGTSVGVSTNDNGNTGSGGAQTAINVITVNVNAVNDAPSITRPATVTTNEDTPFTFSGGNVVSVADVDAASGSVTVTLGVSHGIVTLSGTTNLTVSGNGTASITASGTLTDLNNALSGMTYTPALNYNSTIGGNDTLSIGVNDNGNTGTGGALTDSKSTTIIINAVNDAPVAVADSYSTNEDTPLSVSAPGVLSNDSDVDSPSITAIQVSGPSHASSFTLNADGSFSYTPVANYNGPDSFTYKANDGSLDSNTVTVSITVNAVNDAPVNSLPTPPTFPQDTVLTMSGAGAIQISDVDAGTNPVQVALTAANGTMSLNGTTGLSFTAGDGTADATMTFTGTISAINTALNGMTFTPSPGYFGNGASIQIVTDDQGNTGSGGALTDTDTLTMTVQQNDQPPVNSVPGAQTINEDATLTFSSGNGNAISISDPDSTGSMKVTLTVTQGTLTLSGTTGLSFTTGDGTADVTMTFTGSISNINTALNGMVYTPNANANGTDTLTITTNDQEAVIPGGPKSDTDTVTINITAINDAPVINRPATVTATEDTVFTFNGGNTISITDVDAGAGTESVTLSVSSGTLTLSGTTGLTVSGNGTASITMSGTLTNLNNALNGMTYLGTQDFNGSDTLSIGVNDGGNTGSGGPLTDSKTVGITVSAVNDAPVNSVPGTQTFDEDTTLTFSTGNGNAISVSDVDVAAGNLTVTLTTTAGTMSFGSVAGLSAVTNNAATITGTGTLANVNAALQGLVFTPTLNLNGAQTISLTTSDNGNTGSGGTKTDIDVINLSINAVNDAPTLNNPANFSINEDQVITFTGGNALSVADVDANGSAEKVTLDVSHGKINLSTVVGLTFVDATANNSASVHVTGTIANINNALNNATYTPAANFNNTRGSESLVLTINDLGNTGSGGALGANATMPVSIAAVNDAPVAKAKSLTAQANMKITYQINLANDGSGDVSDADIGDGGYTPTFTLNSVTPIGCATCVISNINSATGTFDFEPSPGTTGTITLNYTVNDNGNPGPGLTSPAGTITVTVNGPVIWFVDGTNGNDANNGTLAHPFKTLAAVSAVDAAGHRIFLYGTNTYTGSIALNTNEWLIGQSVTSANNLFDEYFGITPPAGTIARPSINGTSANAAARVTVASSDKLDGLDMDGTSAQIDNYTTGTFPTGTPTAATGLTVNVGRMRRTGAGNVIAIGGTGNSGTFSFKSVSATGVTGSTQHGVFINSFTGPFTVAGTDTGVTPNGGTISGFGGDGMHFSTVSNGGSTAVSLQKMTLTGNGISQSVAGNASTCGGDLVGTNNLACVANLYLSSVSKTSLDTMTVSNSGQMGINANNVTDLTLNNSTVSGNGNESAENGLTVLNVLGTPSTLTITDTNFTNNINRAMYIEHRSGTPTVQIKKVLAGSMTIDNTAHLGSGSAAQGILFGTDGNAAATLQVDGVAIQNNVSNGLQLNIQSTSSLNGFIQNCSFATNAAGIALNLNNSATFGTSTAVPFVIQNNTGFTGNTAQAMNISNGSGATGSLFAKIVNNTIGTATAGSVCDATVPNCDGIDVKRFGPATFSVLVSGNTIKSFGGAGIFLDLNQSGNSAVKVSNNNISNPYNVVGVTSPNAMYGTFGASVGGSVCLDISANTISAGDPTLGWAWNTSGADIELYSKNSAVVSIAGYSGGNSNANVQTYIGTTANPGIATPNGGGTKVFASATSGSWANGPASCSTP
jgi:VCBS repeat-containing protein